MVDGDVFRISEAADAAAAEQEGLVAAAEEAAIATRQMSCSHLRMTRPIRTKMRATTTVLTTMTLTSSFSGHLCRAILVESYELLSCWCERKPKSLVLLFLRLEYFFSTA